MSQPQAPRPPLPRSGRLFWIIGLAFGIVAGTAAAILLANAAPGVATPSAVASQG